MKQNTKYHITELVLYAAIKTTAILRKLNLWIIFVPVLIVMAGCDKRTQTGQTETDPRFLIRVLLFDDVKTLTLEIPAPFEIAGPDTQIPRARFDHPPYRINASVADGRISIGGWSTPGNELLISTDKPHILNINGENYRGKLKLILATDCNSFDAVNVLGLEPYLAGVIGAEMPSYWEPEALKAQAITARTYCLYIKRNFGENRHWDLRKTQANQAYRGLRAESAQTSDAVNRTKGLVLTCRQGTRYDLFPAYYGSSCGGHTENSRYVFGGDYFQPLAGTACPYCRQVAKPRFFFWPTFEVDKAELTARLLGRYPKLKKLGRIDNLIVNNKSDYKDFSRLTRIKLVGSNKETDWLRAEDFRLAIDPTGRKFKSAACKIRNMRDKWGFAFGRGYGHGVGMCQCGAQAMAREGKTAESILLYYYPGSRIENTYENDEL